MEFESADFDLTPQPLKGELIAKWKQHCAVTLFQMNYNLDDDIDFLQVNEPKMFYGASNIIFENAKQLRNRLRNLKKYYGSILRKRNLE